MTEPARPSYPGKLSYEPQSCIVLIGTSTCPLDPTYLPPLPQVKANLEALKRLCSDPRVIGLPAGAVTTLLDVEHASEIASAVAAAARKATDTFIVYYAGHGLYGTAETPLFLVARNSTDADKAYSAVPINLVKMAFRESPATKRVLILDCCYSGRALDGGMSSAAADAVAGPTLDVKGVFGIAAAPGDARALAPPDEKFTRFTGALVDILEHGVKGCPEVLTLGDVFVAVEARIRTHADAPLPKRLNWENGEAFRFAHNRASSPDTVVLLPEKLNEPRFPRDKQKGETGAYPKKVPDTYALLFTIIMIAFFAMSWWIESTTADYDLHKRSRIIFNILLFVSPIIAITLVSAFLFGRRSGENYISMKLFAVRTWEALVCGTILAGITLIALFFK